MSGRLGNPAQQQTALRWLAWARDDLADAQAIARSRNRTPRNACYLAQQCAEKAIKAALIFLGTHAWGHDLDALNNKPPPSFSG